MSVSQVAICNLALTALSTARISSLTEDSENARKCNAVFEMLRDDLLERHNWNFAMKQAELGELAETPTVEEWTVVFQLPSDCIRVWRMEGDGKFERYGNKIYTNEPTAKIEYVSRVEDTTIYTPGFVKALASYIARELAYGITQSSTVQQMMAENFKDSLREAKQSDGQEGSPRQPRPYRFLSARV